MATEGYGVFANGFRVSPAPETLFLVSGVQQVSVASYTRVGGIKLPRYNTAGMTFDIYLVLETTDTDNSCFAVLYDATEGEYVGSDLECDSETAAEFSWDDVSLTYEHVYEIHIKQETTDAGEAAICAAAWMRCSNPTFLPPS